MIAHWHRQAPRLRATLTRLARQLGDLLLLLLSAPFIALGWLVGWSISLTLWVIACVLAGYAQGRNRNA